MTALIHQPAFRCAIDLDGVICNFQDAFARLIKEELGKDIPVGPNGPTEWDWHLAGGVTKAENEHLWWLITTSPDFWNRLQPYPNGLMTLEKLEQLTQQGILEPYFITSRPSNSARAQSIQWLTRWGMSAPQVLTVKGPRHKGVAAMALGIEASVDDNAENVLAFAQAGAQSFIVEWPYNSHVSGNNIFRVKTPYAAVTAMAVMAMERR